MQSLCCVLGTLVETMAGLPIPFEQMKDELEGFKAFIGDAKRMAAVEDTKEVILRKIVKQAIEAYFRLKDVIDEYEISEEQRPGGDAVSVYAALLSCDITNVLQTMVLRHQIKYKYEDFRFQFLEIKKRLENYGGFQSSSHQQNPGSPPVNIIDEADIVGFEAPSAELVSWLLDNGSQARTLISVVGMGGLGKTTLARKVFRSDPVAEHFDCRGWFTVSQSYTIEVLLKHMWEQFFGQSGDYYPTAIELIITKLRDFLQQKRYVLFFDDVWDPDFWDNISSVLPENMNGSRIFITTRNMNVAMHCNSYFNVKVHLLQALTHEESSELFYRKAFRSQFKGGIPEPLQDISSEIIHKCKGNPLAIAAVGIFLSHKSKTMSEWKRFSRNFSYVIGKDPILYRTIKTLSLSYNDLPLPLKTCLLYFAIYPRNYEVKSKRLIRQWIAEGFVKEEHGKTLEEVAEGYLTELIDRSLVQRSLVSIDGKVKGCRVHDLIREMILRKVDNLRFCKCFTTEDDPSALSGITRRLSIVVTTCNDDLRENLEKRESSSHLRSLFFFTEKKLPEKLVRIILTKHKQLKLLDFESAGSCHVPENFGVLIHLKYLSLRNTEMLYLPKSIGKLQNLETLDLRQTRVNELPKEVSKLKKLRHLLGDKLSLINLTGGGIGEMSSLQTLSSVGINENGTGVISELEMLTQLRKLSLFDVREGQGTALCQSISKMPLLEKLYIETNNKNEVIDLSCFPCPTKLQKLRLQARLNKLPDWIRELENLVELSLSYSYLIEDPLESLKSLPNLLVLNLAIESYEGKSLHFPERGFQKLKEISLRYLHNLSSIIVDGEPLPCLEKITFMNIPNLKEVAASIFNLKKLPVLNSYFMPAEFDEKIAPLIKDKKCQRKYNKDKKCQRNASLIEKIAPWIKDKKCQRKYNKE